MVPLYFGLYFGVYCNMQKLRLTDQAHIFVYENIPENYKRRTTWNLDLIEAPICKSSNVLYLVKTARTNFGLRKLLRSQHDHNQIKQINLKTQMLFLIGFDSEETQDQKNEIENEINEFGDFIIGDYFDAYHNLTQKTLSAHKYVNDYCTNVDLILIRDDDTLINENDLFNLISNDFKPMRPYCLGNLRWINASVIRSSKSKYSQSPDEYPLSMYPPYCGGACSLFSLDYIIAIFDTASHTNPGIFLHDDVFFTGVLRTKAGLDLPENVPGVCRYFKGESSIPEIKAAIKLQSAEDTTIN